MRRLEAENISMRIGDKTIIEDVSIGADPGELVCLLGVSGSGKTTLFNCLSGIYEPTEGRVLLDGEDITGKAGMVSYMLQKDLLLPHKTIEDNVSLPLVLRGMKKEEARVRADELLETFGLAGTQRQYPRMLSGGMRQRAALMRTYMFSDRIALLDEPFSALDTITKGKMHEWYLDIMEEINLTTLFITHDINEAIYLSDRIFIMAGTPGRIVKEIEIDAPRNGRRDFELTEGFLEYKREIISFLE